MTVVLEHAHAAMFAAEHRDKICRHAGTIGDKRRSLNNGVRVSLEPMSIWLRIETEQVPKDRWYRRVTRWIFGEGSGVFVTAEIADLSRNQRDGQG